ncbi:MULTISPECIES: response regulator transcription factor [unclassified Streptomyces]|uniref:response regulator transcription factor n=1 Tax=unclassified Streptomyces TaxID=2593676 RepID=UPI0004C244F4|nr:MULTISPECIES: response regulator transcription factor [unclassified Streptomyces]
MHINLFILCDDPVSLAGLESIIDKEEKVSLIGRSVTAGDGMRCLDDSRVKPHVVILGEPPSKRSICENVQQILTRYRLDKNRPKIIVVSQNDDDDVVLAAVRVGVNGYLTRMSSSEELLDSIQLVAKGGAAFSQTIAARFSRYFSSVRDVRELSEPIGLPGLTSRELEILTLLASGLGNRQIARRLFLAEKTVRNYVSRILTKLEVHDRASAALLARDAGLGAPAAVPS